MYELMIESCTVMILIIMYDKYLKVTPLTNLTEQSSGSYFLIYKQSGKKFSKPILIYKQFSTEERY